MIISKDSQELDHGAKSAPEEVGTVSRFHVGTQHDWIGGRLNLMLMNLIRWMLIKSGSPCILWAEELNAAYCIRKMNFVERRKYSKTEEEIDADGEESKIY